MATIEKVTVDKAYFDALLRRADCHTSARPLTILDPANITISQVEYNSLLRASQEYDLLKNALFQGGITAETLELLISKPQSVEQRFDSAVEASEQWNREFSSNPPNVPSYSAQCGSIGSGSNVGRNYSPMLGHETASVKPRFSTEGFQHHQHDRRTPSFQRQTSLGMTSVLEDVVFDNGDEIDEGGSLAANSGGLINPQGQCTLFFSGLPERTTYRDLVSVIHCGKLLSIYLRPDRTALVTFVNGAADFLAWTKRNDLYLHGKRIEAKWADRQYRINPHIAQRVTDGASRNIVLKSATVKGLTEEQIRDDMEHIHNLVIIDVVFRNGDAFVSTNSVHNALFARTCMMSRSSYRGCRVEFFRDECDTPAPVRGAIQKAQASVPATNRKPSMANRFNMLNLEDVDDDSDEENRTPSNNHNSNDETVDD